MRGEFYHPQESVCARARSRFAPGAPWLEDPNWRVRTWSLPLLWSRAPPPVITTPPPGSRSAAEVAVPLAADRPELPVWGGGRGSPSTGELVLLSYPSCAPHLAPTANSGAAERGPRQVEEGKRAQARGRAGGGEGGACPPLL